MLVGNSAKVIKAYKKGCLVEVTDVKISARLPQNKKRTLNITKMLQNSAMHIPHHTAVLRVPLHNSFLPLVFAQFMLFINSTKKQAIAS